jgi:hypothetical protein
MLLASSWRNTSLLMRLTSPRPFRLPNLVLGAAAVVAFGFLLVSVERGWLAGGRDSRERGKDIRSPGALAVSAPGSAASGVGCPSCGTVHSVGSFPARGDNANVTSRVTVRMDDGSFRSFAQPQETSMSVGERVRVVDGAVVSM